MSSRGKGRGAGRGRRGIGPPSKCRCTSCGYETSHTPGVPCINQKCPNCYTPLVGAD